VWTDRISLLGDDDGDEILTLTLTDGGAGDADGVANGEIVDPGGVASSLDLRLEFDGFATTLVLNGGDAAATYDIVRGGLSALRSSGGNFTTSMQTCLADDHGETSAVDLDPVGVSDGFWYLVRGTGCCGSWPYDAPDTAQVGSRDAEIEASPLACD
jgi:hypothetical protein